MTQYLNESGSAAEEIRLLLEQTPAHLLTLRFNQSGQFYLVCDKSDRSVGFTKLCPKGGGQYEVVYVIGEEALWGRGIGHQALRLALNKAFFEKRADAVSAKIHPQNHRSVRTALSCGMCAAQTTGKLAVYSVSFGKYLKIAQNP